MNKELLNVVKKLMKTHTAVSNFSCAINCEILCGNIVVCHRWVISKYKTFTILNNRKLNILTVEVKHW
jgi:hypothetical protein